MKSAGNFKKWWLACVATVVFVFAATCQAFGQASVTTDKPDYLPGNTVQISGSGFTPGETVQLQVLNLTDPDDNGPEHQPWQVAADANGNVATTWYVTPDELGMTLQLTATGLTSGLMAQATFTDGSDTWIGGASGAPNDWNTAANWSGGVPGNGDDVIIPGSLTFYPILTNGQSFSLNKSLTINSGGQVTINSGATLTVNSGATVVNGTLNISGTYNVGGQNMNSGSGTINVTGGTFTSTASIGASALNVTISAGTFSVGSISAMNTYTASGGITIFTVGNFTITTFTATGGTVEYNSVQTQNISPGSYYNLILTNSAKKVFQTPPPTTTVRGNLSIYTNASGAFGLVTLDNGLNASVNSLSLGGVIQVPGTWGSSVSTATHKNNTYFDNSQQGILNVVAAAATKLAFTTQPTNTTAGLTMTNVVVQVEDAVGNPVAQLGTAITLTLNGSTLFSGTNPQTTDYTGKATFSDLVIRQAGTNLNFSAAGGGLTGTTSSNFNITASAATQLVYTTVPTTGTAGTAFSVTVASEDAFGNPSSPTSNTTLTLSKATGGGTLSGTLTGTIPTNGTSVTISTPVYSKSDTMTLTVTPTAGETGLMAATSGNIVFSPGAVSAAQSTTAASPASVTADGSTTSTITVTLKDANGNPVSGKTVTLAKTSGSGSPIISAASGTSSALGVVTFTVKSTTAAADVFTATDTSDSVIVTQTATVTFTAGAANRLGFTTQPVSTTAGSTLANVVVQIEDVNSNAVAQSGTAITLTLNGSTIFSGTNPQTTDASGKATFNNLVIRQAGTGLNFSAAGGGLIGATSGNFNITAAAANQLVFGQQPTATTAGSSISPSVTVIVKDQYGNTVTTDNSSVTIGGTSFNGGTLTVSAVNGVATFNALNPIVAGGAIMLTASDGALTGATSNPFTVNPAAASRLAFTTQPVGTTNGATLTAVVVQLQDQFSNNVAGSGTNISLTLNGGGTLGGTTSLATDASGKATFNNLNVTGAGGGATFTASASPLTSATSSSFNVAQASTTAAANSSANPSVFGSNVVFSVAVSASAPGSGTPTGTATFEDGATILGTSALVSGSATYTNGSLSAGSHSITVIYSGDANFITSTSSILSQVVNQANQTITFGALPNSTYGAAMFGLTATASSGLPVSFSIASGPATISGTNLTITGAGTVIVKADQPGNGNYNAATTVQQTFTVNAATLTVSGITASNRVYNGGTNASLNVSGATLVGVIGLDNVTLNTGGATGYFTNGNVGTQTVFVSGLTISGSSATNYSLTQPTTTASITAASSTNAVSTSANPVPVGSNVVLTATITAIAPGGGTPTGAVQFLVDGSPLGSPVALNGGAASVTNNSLSNGFHVITVQYAGDGNFTGSTNNLSPDLLVNSAPVAQTATYPRPANFTLKIRIATLATNWSDADGGTITLSSVAATSTNGISMSKDNTYIYYNGANGSNPDQFTYVISDGFAPTMGMVNIVVTNAPGTCPGLHQPDHVQRRGCRRSCWPASWAGHIMCRPPPI